MNDKKHPVKVLETWKRSEEIIGVAGGAVVPLLGGVVLEFQFLDDGEPTGPAVRARFKIAEEGKTDKWCPIILGARALDCVEKGGLGFTAGFRKHLLTGIGIQVERYEPYCPPITDGIYTMRSCVIGAAVMHSIYQARTSVLDTGFERNETTTC